MKQTISTIILLLLTLMIPGQATKKVFVGQIVGDSNTIQRKVTYGILQPISRSPYKIELRFIVAPSFDNETCFVIKYDTLWTISKISFDKKTSKYISTDLSKKVQVEPFFDKLVQHNIFSLPEQKHIQLYDCSLDLNENMLTCPGMTITDGTCYQVDFMVSGLCRSYLYCNPVAKSKFYHSDCFLKDMAAIVTDFENLPGK
jgi:hypothetical protein